MALDPRDADCPCTRREALERALSLAGGFLVAGSLVSAAFGEPSSDEEILVSVFLRGACDGLSAVMPLGGKDRAAYEAERPTLKIDASGPKGALSLNGDFGLHPSARALHQLYEDKKLAIVLAAGLPSDTRSHFDAQNYMELGTPDKKSTTSGWLARHLDSVDHSRGLAAVAVGALPPTAFLSDANAAAVASPAGFNLGGKREYQAPLREALRRMYASAPAAGGSAWLGKRGLQVLDTIDLLEGAAGNYQPANKAEYPKGEIGNKLKTLAQLIKMPLGLKVASVDMGGWDTHKYQGSGSEGYFANLLGQLSDSLGAFWSDLRGAGSRDDFTKRLTLVVMSEFGRRVKENANHGTDHGHGNLMLALGGGIEGGKLYGAWPGLEVEQLYQRADLAVTTDYRRVLWELLSARRRETRLSHVFPGYEGYAPLGLARPV